MTLESLQPWTFVIVVHAAAALAALVVGGVQVLRNPKGDDVHRLLGRVWATTMLVVAAGSFLFGSWDRPVDWFLRALATWTLISVSLGWRAARAGDVAQHRGNMVGTYVGLLIAFGFVFFPGRLLPTWLAAHPGRISLAGAVVVAAAVGVVVAATTRGRERGRGRVATR